MVSFRCHCTHLHNRIEDGIQNPIALRLLEPVLVHEDVDDAIFAEGLFAVGECAE